MKCLYCSKPLSVVQRFRKQRYCSAKHRRLYIETHDEKAFGELMRRDAPDEEEAEESVEAAVTAVAEPEEAVETPEVATALAASIRFLGLKSSAFMEELTSRINIISIPSVVISCFLVPDCGRASPIIIRIRIAIRKR